MESLLTSSESHAFQSFLSSISDTQDWNADIDVPTDKLALAKATKDLMALDQSHWQTTPTHQQDLLPYHPRSQSSLPPSHLFLPPPPSDSSSRTPTPTSASPFTFAPSAQIMRSLDSSIGKQSKRPRTSHPHPYDVSTISHSSPRSQSVPRLRRSQSQSHRLASPSTSTPSPSVRPSPKPALLTASQKKANHIQSEQKRRANIRRGYDALCDCVPALREAIREEEEEATAAERSNGAGVPVQGKVRKGKMVIKGRDGEEKVDGRAGPRSENIVLSKTIDYINDLLDERNALLARLHRARSSLPPGHPALIVPPWKRSSQDNLIPEREEDDGPLWEREWKGGLGKLSDYDEGEDSS